MFRRSGSVTCFIVEGGMPTHGEPAFAAALARERFKSIESAASEQVSIGWATPGDPSGETFEAEDMDAERACWLRVRIDKKALPSAWVEIHRSAAERSRGRPLGRRELREFKEELERDLLPRLLPAVRLLDVLYLPSAQRVYLFGTGKGLRDEFGKLFRRTFDVSLRALDPQALAESLPLGREQAAYLDRVSPVKWPRAGAHSVPLTESEDKGEDGASGGVADHADEHADEHGAELAPVGPNGSAIGADTSNGEEE